MTLLLRLQPQSSLDDCLDDVEAADQGCDEDDVCDDEFPAGRRSIEVRPEGCKAKEKRGRQKRTIACGADEQRADGGSGEYWYHFDGKLTCFDCCPPFSGRACSWPDRLGLRHRLRLNGARHKRTGDPPRSETAGVICYTGGCRRRRWQGRRGQRLSSVRVK